MTVTVPDAQQPSCILSPRNERDAALFTLLSDLDRRDYAFVTPTPATHARVVARTHRREAATVEDMLGWSLPFRPGTIDAAVEAMLAQADAVETIGERRRATIRVSRLHDRLFIHSAYPTDDEHAVFFGPDSYRFADLIQLELGRWPLSANASVVDIGTGSGVGAIVVAGLSPGLRLHMTDINPAALRFARINAAAAGVSVLAHHTDDLACLPCPIDLAVANPPYIIDTERRLYRDGGAMHGGAVPLAMARMAMRRLAPAGRLILYTGSAIVAGQDALHAALAEAAEQHDCTMAYREIDPDVFGEELDNPAYHDVDRIALVAAIVTRDG